MVAVAPAARAVPVALVVRAVEEAQERMADPVVPAVPVALEVRVVLEVLQVLEVLEVLAVEVLA